MLNKYRFLFPFNSDIPKTVFTSKPSRNHLFWFSDLRAGPRLFLILANVLLVALYEAFSAPALLFSPLVQAATSQPYPSEPQIISIIITHYWLREGGNKIEKKKRIESG